MFSFFVGSFSLLLPLQCSWFINLGDNESSAPVGGDKFMARMLMAQIEVRVGRCELYVERLAVYKSCDLQ